MHRITTIVKNELPAPYTIDVSVTTNTEGTVEDHFDHLEAVLSAACFHKDSFGQYISERVAEDEWDQRAAGFNLLARAAETLEVSPLQSDRALAEEISLYLTGNASKEPPETGNLFAHIPQAQVREVDNTGDFVPDQEVPIEPGPPRFTCGDPDCVVCGRWPFAPAEGMWGKSVAEQLKVNALAQQLVPEVDGEDMLLVVGNGMILLIDASENVGGLFAKD